MRHDQKYLRHRRVLRRWLSLVLVLGLQAPITLRPLASAAAPNEESAGTDQQTPPSDDVTQISDVSLMESPVTERAVPVKPEGGFDSLERFDPSPVEELVSERSATTETWLNDDGSLTVNAYALPRFFRPRGSSEWLPIDTSVVPDEDREGRVRSAANQWEVSFGATGSPEPVQKFELDAGSVTFSPVDAVGGVAPVTDGSMVSYAGLWPNVDAVYAVSSVGVDERLVLHSADVPSSFSFAVSGSSPRPRADGGVDLFDGDVRLGSVPPLTVDLATGPVRPQAAGAEFVVAADVERVGGTVTVIVDPDWLAGLPEEAFPVVIDPTFFPVQSATSTSMISNSGSWSSGLRVGQDLSSGVTWRSKAYVPIPARPTGGSQPWQLVGAVATVDDQPGSTAKPGFAFVFHGGLEPMSFTSVVTGGTPVSTVNSGSTHLAAVGTLVAGQGASATGTWYGLKGDETSGVQTLEFLTNFRVEYAYYQSPDPVTLTSPTGQISTTTPLLVAPSTSDPSTIFRFKIATELGGGGIVLDSGWRSASTWQVPDGALTDGATYWVWVWTAVTAPAPFNGLPALPPAQPTSTQLKINKRLGGGGPSPTDTVGAVPGSTATPSEGAPSPGVSPASVTVNMVTGNLAVAVNTHPLSTLGGTAGVSLNYDSLGSTGTDGGQHGLLGRYMSGSTLIGQRLDPTVNFEWPGSPMGGYEPSGPVSASWTGYVRVSAPTGSWHLGGVIASGTMSITLDDVPYVTLTAGSTPTFGAAKSWTGGSLHKINIEYASAGVRAGQLWAWDDGVPSSSPASKFVVPSEWLTPRITGLPAGWRLSANPYSGSWTRLDDLGTQVVLHSSSGMTATFTRRTDGSYAPPSGSTDLLAVATTTVPGLMNAGEYTVSGGGVQMAFGRDGWVRSATTLADDRRPTALSYAYATLSGTASTPVLTTITDPVTGRSINLCYGTSACTGGGSSSAPDGLLGRINYWDGTSTTLTYVNGQLARVANPGGITADFGYDSYVGGPRLISVRDPLAYDAIAAGQRADCPAVSTSTPTCSTQITYDAVGKVATVTQPAPTPGATRTTRTYIPLNATSAKVQITGFSPSSTYATWVRWDTKGRVVEQKDAIGRSTTTIWDPNIDRPLVTIDPAGLQTTNVYDGFTQYLTDNYGPAPSNCFSTTAPYTPAGACSVTVPRTQHRYDEGIQGLAATFWDNPYFAGAPKLHTTGPGGTGPSGPGCYADTMCTQWNTLPVTPSGITRPSCCAWTTGSPFTWSMRLTGVIESAAAFSLIPTTTQRVMVYVDGLLYLDMDAPISNEDYTGNYGEWWSGVWPEPAPIPAGKHHIQIDFLGSSTTLNGLWFFGIPGSGPFLSNSVLSPDYGLETSTEDPDGKKVARSYSDPSAGIGPELGLVTSVTQDPVGLALTSTTSYEAPSSGRWLRKTSATLPAGTVTSYTHYCSTNTVTPTDCDTGFTGALVAACGVTSGASQWGLVAQQTDPAPNPASAPRVQQFVYDPLGRIVGRRVGTTTSIGSQPWQCTSYDNRGRTTSQTYPAVASAAARTVTSTYSVGGNPLKTSVADDAGTITSKVDLLGRIVEYTDAAGRMTTYAYDSTGRSTSTTTGNAQMVRTYDANSSQLSTVEVKINGAVQASATISYNSTTGRMSGVVYNGGQMYLNAGYDGYGNQSGIWFEQNATPDPIRIAGSTITRSPGGRQIDSYVETGGWDLIDPNPSGNNYTYDGAGRLVTAHVAGGHYDYSYANNPTADNCTASVTGANIQAGKNTNRTASTWHPTTGPATSTHSCYNTADQLKATIIDGGTPNTTFNYDTRGNQTLDGPDTYTWDSADRLAGITNTTTTVSYFRDAVDRPLYRTVNGSSNFYGYNGFGDTPAALLDDSTNIIQRFYYLPGGVLVTINASGYRTWSYPDHNGHYITTTDNTGTRLGSISAYDPWGAAVPGTSIIDNTNASTDLAAYGTSGKLEEHATTKPLILMGARPYNAARARFLSVDPVKGGCANDYTYVHGDPLNAQDLDGKKVGDLCGMNGPSLRGLVTFGVASVLTAVSIAFAVVAPWTAAVFGAAAFAVDVTGCYKSPSAAGCLGAGLDFGSLMLAGSPGKSRSLGLASIVLDALNGSKEASAQLSGIEYGWYRMAYWQDCWASGGVYPGRWSAGRYE